MIRKWLERRRIQRVCREFTRALEERAAKQVACPHDTISETWHENGVEWFCCICAGSGFRENVKGSPSP